MKFDILVYVLNDDYQIKPRITLRKCTGIQSAIQRAAIGLISLLNSDLKAPNRGIDYISIHRNFNNFPVLFSISLENFLAYCKKINPEHDLAAQINNITFDGVEIDKNTRSVRTTLTLYNGNGNTGIMRLPIQI